MSVCEKAKERFGVTNDPREAGFIFPDGTMLDFTGRREACGYDKGKPTGPDYLQGQRNVDHREVKDFYPGSEDPTSKLARFMRDCKAIRVMSASKSWSLVDLDINFVKDITSKQKSVLKAWEGTRVFVDIDDLNGISVCSKTFEDFTVPGLDSLIAECKTKIHPEGHIVLPNDNRVGIAEVLEGFWANNRPSDVEGEVDIEVQRLDNGWLRVIDVCCERLQDDGEHGVEFYFRPEDLIVATETAKNIAEKWSDEIPDFEGLIPTKARERLVRAMDKPFGTKPTRSGLGE